MVSLLSQPTNLDFAYWRFVERRGGVCWIMITMILWFLPIQKNVKQFERRIVIIDSKKCLVLSSHVSYLEMLVCQNPPTVAFVAEDNRFVVFVPM